MHHIESPRTDDSAIEQGRRPSQKQIESLDKAWERATARG